MKLHLVNTANGFLVPESDFDYYQKRHLKVGETYSADIHLVRNAEHHRKYFKMIRTAWEYLPEPLQYFFHNSEGFRKHVEMTAGYSEPFFSPKLQEWVEGPKSIAFDKLDQAEFEELYNQVRSVLDTILAKYITEEEFKRNFLPF